MRLQSSGVRLDRSAPWNGRQWIRETELAMNTSAGPSCTRPWEKKGLSQDPLLTVSRTKHCATYEDARAMMTNKIDAELATTRHASRWTQPEVTDSERARNGGAFLTFSAPGSDPPPKRTGNKNAALQPTPPSKFCFSCNSNRHNLFQFPDFLESSSYKKQITFEL